MQPGIRRLDSERMRPLLVFVLAALSLGLGGAGAAVQPNDPAWHEQLAERLIRLPEVWEITTGDPTIVVATVDTGVNAIPELEGALVPGWDFVENDGEPQDTHGHGTRVATVIAARGNNQIGMAGYCWQCKIMPVRVSADGSASAGRIAEGINWATEHGARIINVSLSHPGVPDGAEARAVQNAINRGAVVIASAGNSGSDARQYPGAYPNVLAVAATDDAAKLYFWSSHGPWVSLAAPGCHVVTDISTPPGTSCGTSFTPAAVSGVAALLLSRNPSLGGEQVRRALTATARPVPGIAYGQIEPMAAFEWLGLLAPGPSGLRPVTPIPPSPPVVPPVPPVLRPPVPGQLYTRQTVFETGTFKRGFRSTFRVGRGRFELQLLTPLASTCSLSLRSASELTVAAPAFKNLISLTAQVTAGRYTAEVQCRGARTRQYSMGVIAMFPRGGP